MDRDSAEQLGIPKDIRDLTERSVEQARQAVDGFMNAAQEAVSKIETQASEAQAGAQGVMHQTMRFAEQNIASAFDFAQRLARAQGLAEVMQLQTEFAQEQIKRLTEQAHELTKTGLKQGKGD